MPGRRLVALLAISLSCSVAAAASPSRHRGICWVAGPEVSATELKRVVALGADWISQTPFGWMRAKDQPTVGMATTGRVFWGERDEGLVATHDGAHELGLKTMLKPHLWIRGSWPGAVAMDDDPEWAEFFVQYERFITHYAELAESSGIDMLVIGTELKATTASHEAEWRRLIAKLRNVYSGPLTYAANWDEVFSVPFWDALDFIGVNAYFPLRAADADVDTVASLVAAWQPTLDRLEKLSTGVEKRVLFTEIGYRATRDCTVRPWEHHGDSFDERCQARALDALFAAVDERPWVGGMYIWKWFPHAEEGDELPPFSPQGRAGENVLHKRFVTPRGSRRPSSSP